MTYQYLRLRRDRQADRCSLLPWKQRETESDPVWASASPLKIQIKQQSEEEGSCPVFPASLLNWDISSPLLLPLSWIYTPNSAGSQALGFGLNSATSLPESLTGG